MRLGCNCSVGPVQAKLKIISEADGVGSECGGRFHQRARETQWSESERGECQAGLLGLRPGVQLRGNCPRFWDL